MCKHKYKLGCNHLCYRLPEILSVVLFGNGDGQINKILSLRSISAMTHTSIRHGQGLWWLGVVTVGAIAAGGAGFWIYRWRKSVSIKERLRRKREKASSVNIGAIFGIDVGGTLTKIVFFEKNSAYQVSDEHLTDSNSGDSLRRSPGSESQQLGPSVIRGYSAPIQPNLDISEDQHTDTSHKEYREESSLRRSKSLSQLDGEEHRAALRQLYEFMNRSSDFSSFSPHAMRFPSQHLVHLN